ncbi:hypothetical protein PF003_g419 [Phytophthora fragariae]|nr:hypothetical protein PF003_g419 [Phytophthora fragariae]
MKQIDTPHPEALIVWAVKPCRERVVKRERVVFNPKEELFPPRVESYHPADSLPGEVVEPSRCRCIELAPPALLSSDFHQSLSNSLLPKQIFVRLAGYCPSAFVLPEAYQAGDSRVRMDELYENAYASLALCCLY